MFEGQLTDTLENILCQFLAELQISALSLLWSKETCHINFEHTF